MSMFFLLFRQIIKEGVTLLLLYFHFSEMRKENAGFCFHHFLYDALRVGN